MISSSLMPASVMTKSMRLTSWFRSLMAPARPSNFTTCSLRMPWLANSDATGVQASLGPLGEFPPEVLIVGGKELARLAQGRIDAHGDDVIPQTLGEVGGIIHHPVGEGVVLAHHQDLPLDFLARIGGGAGAARTCVSRLPAFAVFVDEVLHGFCLPLCFLLPTWKRGVILASMEIQERCQTRQFLYLIDFTIFYNFTGSTPGDFHHCILQQF